MNDAIEMEAVDVTLGSYKALSNVTFQLPEKGFMAVLGPNGGGKSTLIRVLMGLEKPQSGRVKVLGKSPREVDPREVGYVPQIKTLDREFPALPLELVVSGLRGGWPWRIRRDERDAAMEMLRLAGMEEKAQRPMGQLSGGETQRVYLARALVRNPRLVLLDEPATGMDPQGEADMYLILENYCASHQATVLMITHDWDVARHHASHAMLLNRTVVVAGHPAEVLTAHPLREAFGHVGHKHPMVIPEVGTP